MQDENTLSVQGHPCNGPVAWSYDLTNGQLGSYAAPARLLGYPPAAIPMNGEWWDSLVHPGDRAALRTARSRVIDAACGIDDSSYRCEYRALRDNGRWAWLLELGCLERDATSNAPRLSGMLLDITSEREAQFRLQQRHERLTAIFDHNTQHTLLMTPDGELLEVNQTALAAAGVRRGEVIGTLLWQSLLCRDLTPKSIVRVKDSVERAAAGQSIGFQFDFRSPSQIAVSVIVSFAPVFAPTGEVDFILCESRDITEVVKADKALRKLQNRLSIATTCAHIGLWDLHLKSGEFWCNEEWRRMLGYGPEEESSQSYETLRRLVHPDDQPRLQSAVDEAIRTQTEFQVEMRLRCRGGSWRWIHSSGRAIELNDQGVPQRLAGVHLDLTERKETETRLASAERLESVGRLAAGVAHEINTPIQFVNDSVFFIKDGVAELLLLTEQLRIIAAQNAKDALNGIELLSAECADLPYLAENLPKALERCLEGLKRVAEIVRSMQEFAHPDQNEMSEVDINRAISNALVMARSAYKYVAEIETDFAPLPSVRCYAGELNQVLLNLLVNAAHAITDVVGGTDQKGLIKLTTRLESSTVTIEIADSGSGVPENIRHRIFEPFFTTKQVGHGTGQGLAIAHAIIVKRHRGTIDFQTEMGKGTMFRLRLPIDGRAASGAPVDERPALRAPLVEEPAAQLSGHSTDQVA